MQPKEQSVILLDSPPDQEEYQVARPGERQPAGVPDSRKDMWKERGRRRTQGQRRPRQEEGPGRRGLGSYQKADEPTTGLTEFGHLEPTLREVHEIPSMALRLTPQGRKM